MYAIGDVHGQVTKLTAALERAGLIDGAGHWSGGEATLWFMGDYSSRGPDGIGVIERIMALQVQAAAAGGRVEALLGNHDAHILAAHFLPDEACGGPGGTFAASWLANGGNPDDLARLRAEHIAWLQARPAMARAGARLLAHADATFYQAYGGSVEEVNRNIAAVLSAPGDPGPWDRLLDYFSQRRAFQDGDAGRARLQRFLKLYGGEQFVHGHTPISKLNGREPAAVNGPYVYAGGLAVDVDGGMYLGGPGFAARLPEAG